MAEEVLLSVVAEEILKKVVSLAAEELRLACVFKGDLKSLSEKLEMIQALLHDAESRRVRMKSVQLWLKKLKAIAYGVDDLLDEFAFEVLRRKLEIQNRMRNKVRNFFSLSNPIAFRLKMIHRVKNINFLLDDIYKEANQIGLRVVELLNTSAEHRDNSQTHPFVDDSKVTGRDNDILIIVEMLVSLNIEEDVSFIAIVGMAGIGKTTLAQLVYKNEKVAKHFDVRMWTCVSDDFDVKRLLNEMEQSLTNTNLEVSNMEAMVKKLQENLKGKRYLFVLDNVWNENPEAWDCLRNSLIGIGGSRGSKILVTTRSQVVVSTIQTSIAYHLAGLEDDDSWKLFKQRAFAEGGARETSNLVAVGRRIVKRCGGLPLAIKTVGALMHSMKNEGEWLSVQNSEIWNSQENINGILAILRLSFDHLLSPSLKQCFTYCSILPKDFVIDKNNLIEQWMAHGFLRPCEGSNLVMMEDIGDYYFNILLWNSLLQDAVKDEYNDIKSCKMHDLVHDLARSISKSEIFTLEDTTGIEIPEVRHLALYCNGEIMHTILKDSAKSLRTLFLKSNNVLDNMLLDFKCLRVLNFCGAKIEELPASIGELIHLRYLDISESKIKAWPKSICKVYNLQTLRFRRCRFLKELPKDLRNLICLRHLYFDGFEGCQMPLQMGRLICLQTLPLFYVGHDKGGRIEELGCLKNLRGKLKMCNLERVNGLVEAQRADLSGKASIYKLTLQWNFPREGNNVNEEDVLEGLQPHPSLKCLTIKNFEGARFPSWMRKMVVETSNINNGSSALPLDNLVKVKLEGCKRCEQIPMLGQLPFLEHLSIHEMDSVKSIDASFYGRHSSNPNPGGNETAASLFPALRSLCLRNMPNLMEWMEVEVEVAVAVFPCLEELEIHDCPQLTMAPSHFPCLNRLKITGVGRSLPLMKICRDLTTLTSLRISKVSDLTCLPEGLLQNNKHLADLSIWFCHMLTHVVPHITWGCGSFLQSLVIGACKKLSELPDGLHTLQSLDRLEISRCPILKSIPSLQNLTSVIRLILWACDGLTCLPSGLLHSCTSLETLEVGYCSNLNSFPDLQGLHSLSSLRILYCDKLSRLPDGLDGLTRLDFLEIGGFSEELNSFPSLHCIKHLLSLRGLNVYGCPKFDSLPVHLQHLTALTNISLFGFGVEALPEWLGNLSCLEQLTLFQCEKLMYLPTMRSLTKLKELWINECPLLKERCTRGSGPEWSKISHIPKVYIDGVKVQSQAS